MQLRRILVTGGYGFVGSHLVEALVQRGHSLTTLDNLSSGSSANLESVSGNVDTRTVDLADWERLATLGIDQFDAIFHLAGQAYVPPSVEDPKRDFQLNLCNTLNLLEVLRTNKWPGRLVFASSAAVYGESKGVPFTEEALLDPIAPYGVSKLAAERYVAVFAKLYGLRTASVRFFSLYGPRQTKQVVFDLIDKVYRDPLRLQIIGNGLQTRDLCYVQDAVQGLICVMDNGKLLGETYNVASGTSTSIDALARQICQSMDCSPQFDYTGNVRPGDPETWEVSIDRLKSLGYSPRYSLAEGIASTVEWYRKWRCSSDSAVPSRLVMGASSNG